MATRIQLRQGTTTEHNTFTGAVGEVTYDTNKKQLRVHDGITVGGKIVDDPTRDVTSQVSTSTETVAGKAKIATTAIAQAGDNDTDFLTAKKLRDALNAGGDAPVYALRGGGEMNIATLSMIVNKNISSVTRISAGLFEFTMLYAMPSTNYSVFPFFYNQTNSLQNVFATEDKTFSRTTTKFRVLVCSSSGTAYDATNGKITIGVF